MPFTSNINIKNIHFVVVVVDFLSNQQKKSFNFTYTANFVPRYHKLCTSLSTLPICSFSWLNFFFSFAMVEPALCDIRVAIEIVAIEIDRGFEYSLHYM